MLMILARLVRSESFWAVVKVRSPHTGPGISYIIAKAGSQAKTAVHRRIFLGFILHDLTVPRLAAMTGTHPAPLCPRRCPE